ncbi:MAG: hypothetical protein HY518_00060 [Candidatus Aenigmarchaeota archaeon]|nr:hypothetical protein [Candidatus Aenigmarchaeota archaeon]
MLLFLLGILDMFAGVLLMAGKVAPLTENGLVFLIGILFVLKGAWSMLAAMAAGFFFDFLGIVDIFAGLFLLLAVWNLYFDFFLYMGIVVMLKGLYSFFAGWVSP